MPDVIRTTGAHGAAPLLFFCDHASNAIPPEFGRLGISEAAQAQHIAWDVGAAALTLDLARRFGDARTVLSTFSRLLIDPNRAQDRDDLLLTVSDGVPIPGNEGLSASQREERVTRFFEPYHKGLAEEIDKTQKAFDDPLYVSIHSFTPELMTEPGVRPWHVGVLWAHDEPTARAFIKAMGTHAPDILVGDNEPYDARGFNYTIDRHIKPLGARHLTLEVRHDLIDTEEKVSRIGALLAPAIHDLL